MTVVLKGSKESGFIHLCLVHSGERPQAEFRSLQSALVGAFLQRQRGAMTGEESG